MFKNLFYDKPFYKTMLNIALPIALQNLILSSLNIVDIMMVGQLGDAAIAAVGVANQVFFLLVVITFGISSGAAIFTAQYWGKRNIVSIRKVLGICLILGLGVSFIFTVIAVVFPKEAIGFYSRDPKVIEMGATYLWIVGISYPVTMISFAYSFVLRSVENVKLPMFVSMGALAVNTILNFVLIFGYFGFPAMGVAGSATATTIARFLECIVLVSIIYIKKLPAAAKIREMISFNWKYFKDFMKTTLPVILNESIWAFGVTVYNAVYARIGTESVAAVNITSSVERLAFVAFMGMSNACAIMIGNKIGAGKSEVAYDYGKKFLILSPLGALAMGLCIIFSSEWILSFYRISPLVHEYAYYMLIIFSLVMWSKVMNMILIVGIFRSGGDTNFCFWLDAGGVWLVGVPLALLSAFVFHMPVYWVYALVTAEEFIKAGIGIWRFRSRKWINYLADMN